SPPAVRGALVALLRRLHRLLGGRAAHRRGGAVRLRDLPRRARGERRTGERPRRRPARAPLAAYHRDVRASRTLLVAAALSCGRSPEQGGEEARRVITQADYDAWRRPDVLVAALGLETGDVVADVCAGRGYLTGRLAAAVGPR